MKATKNKSQTQRLLAYLKKNRRGITTMEAFSELGICRLSERIRELDGAAVSWIEKGKPWEPGCKVIKIVKKKERHGLSNVVRYKLELVY